MLKVILDTNVLISSLIQRSYPYLIINHCVIENSVDLCISDDLIAEYLDVINRPKFSRYPDFLNKAEFVMAQIIDYAEKYNPKTKIDIIKDKDDNKLLELALESQADFLITGNTIDFTLPQYKGTRIVSPKDFWEVFRNES